MKNPTKLNLPAKLACGRRRFESWRSSHKPPTRLSEQLWTLAADLAREYGLNRTARTLRLDYNCLKRRVELAVADKAPNPIAAPQFLELPPFGSNAGIECTIECEDAKGAKIRIHLQGRELPDLAALGSVLWSQLR